ncbi:HAD-like domain-containing protein [Naematelia encephala]|uniref:Mitochondrial import inner membrane translocase subunit TIM50 n=1 Tax=Naematelia encephala TaxID=71784 RepID=A0A1Y2AV74_9TREE|nr:HAD-like domain-containing protein [Naematelia encephala]
MIRQSLIRLAAAAPRRNLATSTRILRSRGDRNRNFNSNPSPAERPPRPPQDDSAPSQAFEPIVNRPASVPTPESLESGSIPLTPPPPPAQPSGPTEEPVTTSEPDLSQLPSLDIEPPAQEAIPPPSGGADKGRTGARGKEYVTSTERSRRLYAQLGVAAFVVGGLGAMYFGSGSDESKGSIGAWARMKGNLTEMFDVFNKPAFKTLLPDPLPPPHQRKYTLLVDLEGMLVSSTWDRQSGWRTAKRPGVDYFLAYLSQFYEIVLFTSQPLYTAMPVAEKLDPYQAYLPYKLFRESTRTAGGKTVKDLTYLNRDLSKVILLDTNPEHAALQPDNAIIIKPWTGQGGDKGLVDLIPFLESIPIYNAADVRPVIKAYEGKDIPTEYAKREAEAKRIAVEEWERLHPTSLHGAGSGFLSGLFGSVSNPGYSRPNRPMTYLEQKRAEAQKTYQDEQRYWAEHAEEFAKLIEDDKQRQLAEMKGSLLGFLSGGAAAPKPEEKK